MEDILFIIHSSAMVRRGLTVILQEYFKFEITQLAHSDELVPFGGIKGKNLLLLLQEGVKLPPVLEVKLKENNQVILLAISPNERALPAASYYNLKLNLDADVLQIQQIIQLARNSIIPPKATGTMVGSEELTQREIDVLRKIAIGLSNKEIADTLNISIHTVISHRKNITEKLSIKSISGLTVYAIMNKLLDISDISPNELI